MISICHAVALSRAAGNSKASSRETRREDAWRWWNRMKWWRRNFGQNELLTLADSALGCSHWYGVFCVLFICLKHFKRTLMATRVDGQNGGATSNLITDAMKSVLGSCRSGGRFDDLMGRNMVHSVFDGQSNWLTISDNFWDANWLLLGSKSVREKKKRMAKIFQRQWGCPANDRPLMAIIMMLTVIEGFWSVEKCVATIPSRRPVLCAFARGCRLPFLARTRHSTSGVINIVVLQGRGIFFALSY